MSRFAVGTDHAPRRRVRAHAVPRRPALPWRQWAAQVFDAAVFLIAMGACLSLLWIEPSLPQRDAHGASQEITHD